MDSGADIFAIEKCARFVSMIPTLSDLKMFESMPDMYATCQEFLDLGGGDFEEHAILLANFFQYIDDKQSPGKYRSYLVYGYAMPEGRNVFVMRTRVDPAAKRDLELWSPITGECFFFCENTPNSQFCGIKLTKRSTMTVRLNDPVCPLKHIYCIVSSDNIYANIQTYDFPVLMDYDLTNKKKWKPLFVSEAHVRKYYPKGIQETSVQPHSLMFQPPMTLNQVQILTQRV